MRAKVGDRFKFEYPDEPQFNCELSVVEVTGSKPDDLVFFEDGTHAKQKHIAKLKKVAVKKPTYVDLDGIVRKGDGW